MDRELLSRMISELIVDHDIVGLPGLGSFFCELVPATFSDRGYTINPPYRRLSFKPICTENQLLVDFYSEKNKVPNDISREYIFQFLTGLSDVLKEKKSITLPGLGRLRATKENNFFFVPDEDLDIFPETFALKAVSLKSHPLIEDKVEIPFNFQPKNVPIELESIAKSEEDNSEASEEQSAEPIVTEIPLIIPNIKLDINFDAEEPVSSAVEESSRITEETPEPATETTTEPAVEPTPAEETPVQESSIEEALPAAEEVPNPEPVIETIAIPEADQVQESTSEETPVVELSQEAETIVIPTESSNEQAGIEVQTNADEQLAGIEVPTNTEELTDSEKQEESTKRKTKKWWIIPLVIIILGAIALAVFFILANVAPDFIDSILYTPEELWIINY